MLNGFAAGAGPSPRMFGAGDVAGWDERCARERTQGRPWQTNERVAGFAFACCVSPETLANTNPKRLGPIVKSFDDRPERFNEQISWFASLKRRRSAATTSGD